MILSNNELSTQLNDKLAASLAKQIITLQFRLSAPLSRWFNAYSIRQKKLVVISIGLLASIILIASSFCSFYTVPKLSPNYSSAHIGQASDFPDLQFFKPQITDSLTKKK